MVVSSAYRSRCLVVPGATSAALLLAAAVWVAPAVAAAQAGPLCSSRPAIVSRLPRGAVLDTAWHELGPDLSGCRIVNRRNAWAVEQGWIAVPGRPEQAYRFSEMLGLAETGAITDSTLLYMVYYRFPVKAGTAGEARAAAEAKAPRRPPTPVLREMQRLEREHQEKLRAPSP